MGPFEWMGSGVQLSVAGQGQAADAEGDQPQRGDDLDHLQFIDPTSVSQSAPSGDAVNSTPVINATTS